MNLIFDRFQTYRSHFKDTVLGLFNLNLKASEDRIMDGKAKSKEDLSEENSKNEDAKVNGEEMIKSDVIDTNKMVNKQNENIFTLHNAISRMINNQEISENAKDVNDQDKYELEIKLKSFYKRQNELNERGLELANESEKIRIEEEKIRIKVEKIRSEKTRNEVAIEKGVKLRNDNFLSILKQDTMLRIIDNLIQISNFLKANMLEDEYKFVEDDIELFKCEKSKVMSFLYCEMVSLPYKFEYDKQLIKNSVSNNRIECQTVLEINCNFKSQILDNLFKNIHAITKYDEAILYDAKLIEENEKIINLLLLHPTRFISAIGCLSLFKKNDTIDKQTNLQVSDTSDYSTDFSSIALDTIDGLFKAKNGTNDNSTIQKADCTTIDFKTNNNSLIGYSSSENQIRLDKISIKEIRSPIAATSAAKKMKLYSDSIRYTFELKNVNKFFYLTRSPCKPIKSDNFYCSNIPWSIRLIAYKERKHHFNLGVFLFCEYNSKTASSWKIDTNFVLKLLSTIPGEEVIDEHSITFDEKTGWGNDNMIDYFELMNLDRGFLFYDEIEDDGKILIQVDLKTDGLIEN